MESEGVVLTCTLVTLASTTGGDLRDGKNIDPKKVVGAFLSMTVCAIVAEMNGEIGAGLAIAIAGTALVRFGIPALGLPNAPVVPVTPQHKVITHAKHKGA